MFSFTEQFSAATATAKSQLDKQINIANEYATTAFDGVQQIIALNVSATKASVEKSSAAAKQLFEAKDPAEFFKNPVQPPSLDNFLAYGRELASIASKTQAELLEVVKEQIKDASAAGASVAAKLPTPDAGALAAPFTAPFPNPFAGLFANPFASPASAPASAPVAAPVSAPPAPAAPVAKAPAAVAPPAPAAAPVDAQPEAEAEPAAPATVVNPPAPKAVAAAVAEAVAPEQEETAAQKPGKAKAAAPKANAAGEAVSMKAIKK